MRLKLPFILYFLAGAQTTPADVAAARELKANIGFRNASAVPSEGSLEHCDGVAGAVPARYAAAFPTAVEAVAAYDAAIAGAGEAVGGVAPEPIPEPGKAPVAEQPAPMSQADKVKTGWKPNP